MPDLSDTVAKCRMGTAKKFYTSIASLSHTSKRPGYTPAAVAASYPGGEMWILGDSPAIGLILFDERYSFVYRPAPRFTPDSRYLPAPDPQRLIRVYTEIDREFILSDFYAKLRWHFGADPK